MLIVIHSSTKDTKVRPVERALKQMYPDGFVSLRHRIAEDDTGIPSQPVGHKETKLGAEQRAVILRNQKSELDKRLKNELDIQTTVNDTWLYVGVEGGLIVNESKQFLDITYVALAEDKGQVIVASSDSVLLFGEDNKPYKQENAPPLHDDELYSELSESQKEERDLCIYGHEGGEAALKKHKPTFQGYRQQIVEPILIEKEMDLYAWSTRSTDNQLTREIVIQQAASRASLSFFSTRKEGALKPEQKSSQTVTEVTASDDEKRSTPSI